LLILPSPPAAGDRQRHRGGTGCRIHIEKINGPFLFKEGGTPTGGTPFLSASVENGAGAYPPTPAMKRFADSLSRQKGIKPPPGYKTSISICRKFLSEHAPKKADGESPLHDEGSMTLGPCGHRGAGTNPPARGLNPGSVVH
jgi:hypothetical protein